MKVTDQTTVIIEKVPDDDYSRGVIIHPDHKFKKGIIHHSGDDTGILFEEGDKVFYNRYADGDFHHKEGDKHFLVMRAVDIYGFANENNHKEW